MPRTATSRTRSEGAEADLAQVLVQVEQAGAEGEDDLRGQRPARYEGAVLTATDWTTETLVSQLTNGNIDLNPTFQRRDAWGDGPKKSRFIESLFLSLPVPQLVLAERKGQRGRFLVIDGKQRLLALRQFMATPGEDFSPLALHDLEIRPDLNGKTLADIRNDPRHAQDVSDFDNQTIRTVVVRNWPDEKYLYTVFLRLNTGTVPLSPQELRQALHPGAFVTFADEHAGASRAFRRVLGIDAPDFRMRDVELLVRYFAFARFLKTYSGDLKDFLDETCKQLNAAWKTDEASIRNDAASADAAIEATYEIFGRSAFRRWNGKAYEPRFNRAVFDAMIFFFREPSLRDAAQAKRDGVVSAFKALMTKDPKFVEAVLTTTKSTNATSYRLKAWGGALGRVLKKPLAGLVPLKSP